MPKYMGYREYARHRGVTLSVVQNAIKKGRIKATTVGKRKKIEAEQADVDWEKNRERIKPAVNVTATDPEPEPAEAGDLGCHGRAG